MGSDMSRRHWLGGLVAGLLLLPARRLAAAVRSMAGRDGCGCPPAGRSRAPAALAGVGRRPASGFLAPPTGTVVTYSYDRHNRLTCLRQDSSPAPRAG